MRALHPDEGHFSAVSQKLGAVQGDAGYFRGILRNTPFLIKRMSEHPHGYVVKLRRMQPLRTSIRPAAPPSLAAAAASAAARRPQPEWHEKLPAEYQGSGVRSETEGDYVFLWFHEPLKLSPDQYHDLLVLYLKDHERDFPSFPAYCYDCHTSGSATLTQSAASISTICEACLEKKKEENLTKNERLNTSDARVSLLVPLGILSGSIGWAATWAIFDAVFRVMHTDRLRVPIIVIALTMGAVGLGIGLPIGKILRRSGITKLIPAAWMAVLSILSIVILGEVMLTTAYIFSKTGSVDLQQITKWLVPLALGDSMSYAVLKLSSSIAVGGFIYEISKSKVSNLRV